MCDVTFPILTTAQEPWHTERSIAEQPMPHAGASYAGGYTGAIAYVSTGVNVAWFDLDDDSHDGPAAIMRIVLDVSAVTGADTSGGFGSVYFSDSGPADPGDIKVADFESAAAAESTGEELNTLIGAFYVTD